LKPRNSGYLAERLGVVRNKRQTKVLERTRQFGSSLGRFGPRSRFGLSRVLYMGISAGIKGAHRRPSYLEKVLMLRSSIGFTWGGYMGICWHDRQQPSLKSKSSYSMHRSKDSLNPINFALCALVDFGQLLCNRR
jgi:hypothetical protein